jgi:hypothetical protein
MHLLDVFRVTPDDSLVWIGSASSMQAAHELIKSAKVDPSDAFMIHDAQRNNMVSVRADELPPAVTHQDYGWGLSANRKSHRA